MCVSRRVDESVRSVVLTQELDLALDAENAFSNHPADINFDGPTLIAVTAIIFVHTDQTCNY